MRNPSNTISSTFLMKHLHGMLLQCEIYCPPFGNDKRERSGLYVCWNLLFKNCSSSVVGSFEFVAQRQILRRKAPSKPIHILRCVVAVFGGHQDKSSTDCVARFVLFLEQKHQNLYTRFSVAQVVSRDLDGEISLMKLTSSKVMVRNFKARCCTCCFAVCNAHKSRSSSIRLEYL